MEAIAKTKYLKGSPRKARLVIDLVRGKNVSQALAILKFTNKRAATPVAKCIRSAVANATYSAEQQNIAIDPDDLWIKTCFVDIGPTKNRRRLRPAPQGRAHQERRHYCHITIELTSDAAETKDADKKRGKKKKSVTAPSKETKKTSATKKPAASKPAGGAEKAAAPKPAKKDAEKKVSKPKSDEKAETGQPVTEKPEKVAKKAPRKPAPKKASPAKKAEEAKSSKEDEKGAPEQKEDKQK